MIGEHDQSTAFSARMYPAHQYPSFVEADNRWIGLKGLGILPLDYYATPPDFSTTNAPMYSSGMSQADYTKELENWIANSSPNPMLDYIKSNQGAVMIGLGGLALFFMLWGNR